MATTNIHNLEKAITLRETGKLDESHRLFLTILNTVKSHDSQYVQLMAEYIIQLRLEAKNILEQALDMAKALYAENPHDSFAIRSVSNTLINLGGFEEAVPLLKDLCQLYTNNSLRLGEAQAHLSYAYLRTGKIRLANQLVKTAIHNIELNTAQENYVEVRSSFAYIVKSLIGVTLDNSLAASRDANVARKLANRSGSSHRIRQANELRVY